MDYKVIGFRVQTIDYVPYPGGVQNFKLAEQSYINMFAGKVGIVIREDDDIQFPITLEFDTGRRCRFSPKELERVLTK